jgi:hypothetical protein
MWRVLFADSKNHQSSCCTERISDNKATSTSNALLHLRDVKADVTLHLHVLLPRALHLVVDVLF